MTDQPDKKLSQTEAAVLRRVSKKPSTCQEIAFELRKGNGTMEAIMRRLKALGLVHVHSYVRTGDRPTRFWSIGPGKDAVAPPRQTYQEKLASQREKYEKRNGKRCELTVQMSQPTSITPRRDIAASWF